MRIYCFSREAKKRARIVARRAARAGKLVPACECEICHRDPEILEEEKDYETLFCEVSKAGKRTPLVAHHPNYRFPTRVWWLCDTCHQILHVLQREYGIACIGLEAAKELVYSHTYGDKYKRLRINKRRIKILKARAHRYLKKYNNALKEIDALEKEISLRPE